MSADRGWADVVVIGFAILGVLGGVYALSGLRHRQKTRLKTALQTHRHALIQRYGGEYADGYYATLAVGLDWLDRVYGRSMAWRAIGISLLLAFIYQILFAFIGWIAIAQASSGGYFVLPAAPALGIRLWRGGILLAGMVACFWLVICAARIADKDDPFFTTRIKALTQWFEWFPNESPWIRFSLVGIGVSGVFLFAVALAQTFPGDFGHALAVTVSAWAVCVVSFVSKNKLGRARVTFITGVVPYSLGRAFESTGSDNILAILVLLHLLIPLANALADWASLLVTRSLLADMFRKRPGSWGLVAHGLADVVAAFACIALLLGGLWGLLTLWGTLSPTTVPLDPNAYWHQARANPADGLMLWLMCATTLLPTFIHGVWAVTLWRTRASDHIKAAVPLMHALPDTLGAEHEADLDRIADLIRKGRLSGFIRGTFWWGTVTCGLGIGACLLILLPNGA